MSANVVNGHAENIQAAHGSAHAEIDGAQAGLVGLSAAAIAAKASDWQAVTQALCAQLAAHTAALRTDAVGYQRTEGQNAAAVGEIGAEAHGTVLG
jgi:uncharacterized protein YukE